MTVYITDGKRFGLTTQQIQMILDQGISTFDHLHEAFLDGVLDDLFMEQETFILVGQALLEYNREYGASNDQPKLLHLIKDAKGYGFTDEMIEKLHTADIYTICQATSAVKDRQITELFPKADERLRVLRAINAAATALTEQLMRASQTPIQESPEEAKRLANLGYFHCQFGPSLN